MTEFLDILKEQISKTHTSLPIMEWGAEEPANMAFLLCQTPSYHFKKSASYPKNKTSSKISHEEPTPLIINEAETQRPPGPPHILTIVQQSSYDFFLKYETELANDFNLKELKKAFRLLARRFHPDCAKDLKVNEANLLFCELKAHYQNLYQFIVAKVGNESA